MKKVLIYLTIINLITISNYFMKIITFTINTDETLLLLSVFLIPIFLIFLTAWIIYKKKNVIKNYLFILVINGIVFSIGLYYLFSLRITVR